MGKGTGIGFVFGYAAAGITALLMAPKSGSAARHEVKIRYYEQRKRLERTFEEIKLEASRLESVYDSVKTHVAEEMDAITADAVEAAHEEVHINNRQKLLPPAEQAF
ncbi:YtxH domain-containing protein [Bacillus sp. H-16]|uniref:YtxH domain-containing protein n=1 Tax=Alteribacter salitolerans TaxID=2912333 RepID=UPI0019654173|nr:YtxH domain-containing protein [Alteribacter salitolerans]MBM7094946.1 YtxH domain-containing protein [Alteribacter salitolerans]